MHVKLRFSVDAPLGDVFAYVADTRNDPEWAPLVHSVTQVVGDGPGPGAEYDIEQEARGRTVTLRMRTEAFVADERVVWTMATKTMQYHSTMTFAADSDGTRIQQTNEVRLKPRWTGLVWWFMARRVLRRQAVALQARFE